MSVVRRTGFLSYAHADTPLVERFLAPMRPRCEIQREVGFDPWWDRKILVGEHWKREIATALETADFGLFCITPSFLASEYVTEVELPAFLAVERTMVPVGLEQVDLRRADLKGLEDVQIFRHRRQGTSRLRWFAECAGVNRAGFCDALVTQMAERMAPGRTT